jgi:hypothetical protein
MENYEGVRKMKTQKKFLTTLALASFVCAAGVQADEIQRTQTKYDSTTTPTTVATPDYTNHYNTESDTPTIQPTQQEQQSIVTDTTTYKDTSIRDETLGVSPQVGVLSYTNPNGAYSARAFAGITGSFNFVPLTASPEARLWYVGVTTGVLFSHNGSSSSNFFGSNPSVSATDNSNILYIPADVNLGAGSTGDDSLWKIYPNVGGDLEWQVSKRVSILVRPDVTITPASDTLSATVGATFVSL